MKERDDEYLYISGQHYDNEAHARGLINNRVTFYLEQAQKYGEPVLELACGTGLITIPIAKEGISIMGLDFSEIMLEHAIKKSKSENLNIDWVKGDMANFHLDQKFSTIIMPGVAINWILDNQNLKNCLSCVKTHLKKNGRFIFDTFNPNLEILLRDPLQRFEREYPNPDGEGMVRVFTSNVYDNKTQINHVKFYYSFENKEIIREVKLRMLFPQELDALLHYNGFIIDYKYGSSKKEIFNSKSNYQIVICHKR